MKRQPRQRPARMKKRDLEMALEALEPLAEPKPHLEQYPTPPSIAADLLFFALGQGDIAGRCVADFGCGGGIFAIGAMLLGARSATGFDIDPAAVKLARANAERLGVGADFRVADVASLPGGIGGDSGEGGDSGDSGDGRFDTVLQNPPFGAQRRRADRPFLEAAARCCRVGYSFHMADTRTFIRQILASLGAELTHEAEYAFPIRRTFSFHTRDVAEVDVLCARFLAGGNNQTEPD